jgi:two-component system, sensor histidine kinase and response regulator
MTRILVIEDEDNILDNVIETLELEGFEAAGARDGREGIQMAYEFRPDLILCDIMMPGFSGYEVLATLRNEPLTAITPFVFLTALGTRDDLRHGMELGADDYLTKPFTPAELKAAIHTQMKKYETRAQQYEEQVQHLRNSITRSLPHELRTPLTGLMGCADFLMMDYETIDRSTIYNLAEVMMRSAGRLHRLIENYLLYAQIEMAIHDQSRLDNILTDRLEGPGSVIHDAAQTIAVRVARAAELEVEVADAVIGISMENLQKIVEELVDNAFKFSVSGDTVTVKAGVEGDHYVLHISDEGRGMTEEEIGTIGAYVQFNRAVYEQQGLGLGLVIARQLVELHGGDFAIESVPDEGTTVTARFPLL